MTIVISYVQRPSLGYTPHKAVTLHNVRSVEDAGVRMVKVRMIFNDACWTHDHVASVLITPELED